MSQLVNQAIDAAIAAGIANSVEDKTAKVKFLARIDTETIAMIVKQKRTDEDRWATRELAYFSNGIGPNHPTYDRALASHMTSIAAYDRLLGVVGTE